MNFLEFARTLGHDERLLAAGEEVCTHTTLPLEQLRILACRATDEQRVARLETYFHHAIAARSRLGQGYHDRGEAYVFAANVLEESDLQFIAKQMPMPARNTSIVHKRLSPGATWDVSVRAERWGKDDKQDCVSIVNVGTLELARGARVVVQGNLFSLLCQRVVSDGGLIEIRPTPYSPDDRRGPLHGVDGAAGRDGEQGRDGEPIHYFNSILGAVLPEGADLSQLDAHCGEDGSRGADAGHGRAGGMCKIAEITIRHLEGPLTIFAQAGSGGNGGRGGDGGRGGNGGRGVVGCRTVGIDVPGGKGGDGGHGGDGGRGGDGGHGGLSSNIYVNLPEPCVSHLQCIALPSAAGCGGKGGRGGAGGTGGPGGETPSVPDSLYGKPGAPGSLGADGKQGRDGRSRPAPCIFVNEQRREGETTWISTNVLPNLVTLAHSSMQERPSGQP